MPRADSYDLDCFLMLASDNNAGALKKDRANETIKI